MMEKKSVDHMSEDVLMEILVLLPPESIFRFKSVSRAWRDILSAPSFEERYAAEARRRGGGRLVALFQKAAEAEHEKSDSSMLAKRCNTLPVVGSTIRHIPKNLGHFVNSSNGLILCSRVSGTDATYHVVNPVTGRSVTLPSPPHSKRCLVIEADLVDKYNRSYTGRQRSTGIRNRITGVLQPRIISTGLICEEKGYSVVRVGMHRKQKNVYMDYYSSKEGKWSGMRKLVASGDFCLRDEAAPVVANGVFHWYGRYGREIAVYDPKVSEGHVQLIEVPYLQGDEAHVVTRSSDVLWLGLIRKQNLMFYMLPKGESGSGSYYRETTNIKSGEWVLMYEVNIKKLSKCLVPCKKVSLECLMSESNSDIVALLRQEEKMFLYNLHTAAIHQLHYTGNYHANACLPISPYYTQSSFLSSYHL